MSLPPIDPNAPRIFFDSSVIIAGLVSRRGASYALLNLCELGLLNPVTTAYVFTEVQRNIAEKIPASLPLLERLQTNLNWELSALPAVDDLEHLADLVPTKDVPVLASAVLAQPVRLVTLDAEHFLKNPDVREKSGIYICTPGDLVRQLRSIIATNLI